MLNELTQDELKKQLRYDQDTGCFIRLMSNWHNWKVGDICGYKTPKGYIRLHVCGKYYQAHRLAWLYMTGSFPKEQIDHINRIRDDNRWDNLREATAQQNCFNSSKKTIRNKSGYKGVSYYKLSNKWRAIICVNGKNKSLGLFQNKDDANFAYLAAAKSIHGDFFKGYL